MLPLILKHISENSALPSPPRGRRAPLAGACFAALEKIFKKPLTEKTFSVNFVISLIII